MQASPFGLVSVVISSFNYARFVGDAIDSALALDWPEVEVIVVDDGSTDESPAVIRSYGERIIPIFLSKSGQVSAVNAGFARSRGDVVIFLDADDVLYPSLVRRLASVWRPGVSKVQYQMLVIDAEGKPEGSVFPQYLRTPSPHEIKRWMITSGDYPTPPGSGNAYARSFLEKLFPLSGFDQAADSHCVTAAPYWGDVLTLAEPLVKYRVHGQNLGAMSGLDGARFNREVSRARARFEYGQEVARSAGVHVPARSFGRSLRLLPYRLASLRLAPQGHPIAEDSRERLLYDAVLACLLPQGQSVPARATLFAWLLLVATLPLPAAKPLVLWRFVSASRPQGLRRWLRRLRVVAA
jgi:glycosyltransferase involved in cell wall biosynthesis